MTKRGDKFIMPNSKEFLDRKTKYDPKKDPVWVYLEREMRENEHNKPYNEKVGQWLAFLKDLKYYYHCEDKKKYKRFESEVGPAWYFEMSLYQRELLKTMPDMIFQDLVADNSKNVDWVLKELGVAIKFSKSLLMDAMKKCNEDAGSFLWHVFTAHFKQPPCELLPKYSLSAKLLMSSLFFLDLGPLMKALNELTEKGNKSPPENKTKIKPKRKPSCANKKFGAYLEKMNVPCVTAKEYPKRPPKVAFQYKIKVRQQESLEKMRTDQSFLEKRVVQKKVINAAVECGYKFWEPTHAAGTADEKEAKVRAMLKKVAKPPISKLATTQYRLGPVTYCSGFPRFNVENMAIIPTGNIPIFGSDIYDKVNSEYNRHIIGYIKDPRPGMTPKCTEECNCLEDWGDSVTNHLKNTKCMCGHHYDKMMQLQDNDSHEIPTKQYFYPPNRNTEHWFMDYARIFDVDGKQQFIEDKIEEAVRSRDTTPPPSCQTLLAANIKTTELLKVFLADLTDTSLITPHLPQAETISILNAWCKKRVQGNYFTQKKNKQMIVHSRRRWCDLENIDFKAQAYKIPFKEEEINNLTWAHRKMVMKLFHELLDNFKRRNQLKQLVQTQFLWSTMNAHEQPAKTFRDTFFTYMPTRFRDIQVINPYARDRVRRVLTNSCPLGAQKCTK